MCAYCIFLLIVYSMCPSVLWYCWLGLSFDL